MMRINYLLKSLWILCLFFVVFFMFSTSLVKAGGGPLLYFDPNYSEPKKGDEITATIKIDVAGHDTFGADAVVVYPTDGLDLKSVTTGNFFSDFSYAQSSGRIEIHSFMSSQFASKTGSGDLAKITFTVKKDSGTGAVSFVCTGSGETEIIDTNGDNILNCNNINQLNLTYIGASGSSDNGLPPGYSTPNQCGGTCGSNYNCAAPLYCFEGFCRSTECKNDLTCTCKSTPTPTPAKKSTPKPVPKGGATPEVVVLSEFTPLPLSTPLSSGTPEQATTTPSGGIDLKKIGLIAGGVILLLAIILLIASKGRKNKPPKIIQPDRDSTSTGSSGAPPNPFNPPPPYQPPV